MTTNTQISDKLDYVAGRVDDIHKVVYGNSNPEHGLAFRVNICETFIAAQKKFIWIIVTASIGAMIASIFTLVQLLYQSGAIP